MSWDVMRVQEQWAIKKEEEQEEQENGKIVPRENV